MKSLGVRFNVVQRFVADSARKGGIACDDHNVLVTAAQVATHGHAERCGKRSACVAGPVTVVFALGTQKKTVEPAELAHRVKTIQSPGKHFVYVALMTDIHDKTVTRRVEHPM